MQSGPAAQELDVLEAPEFSVDVIEERHATILVLEGEVDLAAAPGFAGALEQTIARGLPVVVDLGAVAFMDSTGLSVLLRTRTRAEEQGVAIAVSCVPAGSTARLFDLVGLTDVLAVHDGRDEALAALGVA